MNFIQIAMFLYFLFLFQCRTAHVVLLLDLVVLLTFCFPLDDKPNKVLCALSKRIMTLLLLCLVDGYHVPAAFAELTRRETCWTQCLYMFLSPVHIMLFQPPSNLIMIFVHIVKVRVKVFFIYEKCK
jgi:hypothetical protein